MPVVSRIVCEWLIVGFHLGRARDAFDPEIGLPGDELLRTMLLRRLSAALIAVQNTRSTTTYAAKEAEDLCPLWEVQQSRYSPTALHEEITDSRLVLIHQGLLRIESWLRACDDVFEPASNPRLAFDLGIEMGRSFAKWPASDDDVRWPVAADSEGSPPNWSGWEFRNPLKVLELARSLDCSPIVTDFLMARCSDAEMFPPHRWAWGVIEQRLSALYEHVLSLEMAANPPNILTTSPAGPAPSPLPIVVASPKASPNPDREDQGAARGKLEHLGLEWDGFGNVIRTAYSVPIRIEQNQPWRLFLLYASVGDDWLRREVIKAEWKKRKIGRGEPDNHNVENANSELKKRLRHLALTIQSNDARDEREFAYRIEPLNGSLDELVPQTPERSARHRNVCRATSAQN